MKEDIYWVRRINEGNKNDFSQLVKKYKDRIYSFILRTVLNEEDAVELTQETFINAYNGLSTFREGHSFKNWLFTIASHKTIDFLRKKKKNKEQELLDTDVGRIRTSHLDRFIQDERIKKLQSEIEKLPDNYRMVILLKHKENMRIEDISKMMNIPEGTVKVWLHRARMKLKERMLKYDSEPI